VTTRGVQGVLVVRGWVVYRHCAAGLGCRLVRRGFGVGEFEILVVEVLVAR